MPIPLCSDYQLDYSVEVQGRATLNSAEQVVVTTGKVNMRAGQGVLDAVEGLLAHMRNELADFGFPQSIKIKVAPGHDASGVAVEQR